MQRTRVIWICSLGVLASLCAMVAFPASVRDQTRLVPRSAAAVSQSQASELTLTLTDAATRSIQSWIRTAGKVDPTGKIVTAFVHSPDAQWLQPGQRVRAFAVTSRTQMHQGRITRVEPERGGARVEVTLADRSGEAGSFYLTEIVVDRGRYLSVPNVSILEEEDRHVVYVQTAPDQYTSREIRVGLQGELYTEVLAGLKEGDQVVSIGSFFVDADMKLKSAGPDSP